MHPSLKEAVPRDKFQEMIDRVAGINGKLNDASLAGVRWEEGEAPMMYLDFQLVCDNTDKATCEMKIQFAGLQGHITGFHFKDK